MKALSGVVFVALIVWAFVLLGRVMNTPATAQAAVIDPMDTQYATPTFIITATPAPSPTIGYEATLFIAQATADEARRVNAQVTAAHEQVILSQLQLTADTEYRSYQVQSWTAAAGPTIIPLTATQQVFNNTQVAQGQSIVSGFLTATYQAPTQMAAIANIKETERFASVDRFIRVTFVLVIGVFLVSISIFALRWRPPEPKPEIDPQKETVVHMRKDNGQGSFSQTRAVVPCSPEQLTELAEMAVNGERKFGINRLEMQSNTFRSQRETLLKVRQWLIDNHFVIEDGGSIMLNTDGEEFLAQWFEMHKLPDEYAFEEELEVAI